MLFQAMDIHFPLIGSVGRADTVPRCRTCGHRVKRHGQYCDSKCFAIRTELIDLGIPRNVNINSTGKNYKGRKPRLSAKCKTDVGFVLERLRVADNLAVDTFCHQLGVDRGAYHAILSGRDPAPGLIRIALDRIGVTDRAEQDKLISTATLWTRKAS